MSRLKLNNSSFNTVIFKYVTLIKHREILISSMLLVWRTNHKEILCFFSTESQCDRQGVNHASNQRYVDHVERYQQMALLAFPMAHRSLWKLLSFHVVGT